MASHGKVATKGDRLMKTAYVTLGGIVLTLVLLGLAVNPIGAKINLETEGDWDCTGTVDCSDEQADECRTSYFGASKQWSCNGNCWRSNVGGTIAVCEPVETTSSCLYNGAPHAVATFRSGTAD